VSTLADRGVAAAVTHSRSATALRPLHSAAPPIASRRAVLRGGMPGVYGDDGFAQRFLQALETVLDPLFALLDGLPSHFDADLAPDDVLDLLAAWLGIELDERLTEDRRRLVVRTGCELARYLGTRDGVELALHLMFPGMPLEVEDGGRTAAAMRPGDLPPPGRSELVVRCEVPLADEIKAAVATTIDAVRPAHVPYKLRVRAQPLRAET
jgi:phage tail-like protein